MWAADPVVVTEGELPCCCLGQRCSGRVPLTERRIVRCGSGRRRQVMHGGDESFGLRGGDAGLGQALDPRVASRLASLAACYQLERVGCLNREALRAGAIVRLQRDGTAPFGSPSPCLYWPLPAGLDPISWPWLFEQTLAFAHVASCADAGDVTASLAGDGCDSGNRRRVMRKTRI